MFIDQEREIIQQFLNDDCMVTIKNPHGRTFTEKYKIYKFDWNAASLKEVPVDDEGRIITQ